MNSFCSTPEDAYKLVSTCDKYFSFAKFACTDDPAISDICNNQFKDQYLKQRQLTPKTMNQLAYQILATVANMNNGQLPHDKLMDVYTPLGGK